MSLDSALTIATGGLSQINRALAVISQNVANASTPDYATEVATQRDLTAGGIGMGVQAGPTERQIDTQLQGDLFLQDGTVSAAQTRQAALQQIDSVQGTPGGGGDIASLLGNLQDAFSTLQTSPDNQTQQSEVVSAAQSLAQQVNALEHRLIRRADKAHRTALSPASVTLNSTLATIGDLSNRIVNLASGRAEHRRSREPARSADAAVVAAGSGQVPRSSRTATCWR